MPKQGLQSNKTGDQRRTLTVGTEIGVLTSRAADESQEWISIQKVHFGCCVSAERQPESVKAQMPSTSY